MRVDSERSPYGKHKSRRAAECRANPLLQWNSHGVAGLRSLQEPWHVSGLSSFLQLIFDGASEITPRLDAV